jgi:hypothetical protein
VQGRIANHSQIDCSVDRRKRIQDMRWNYF